MDALELLKKDWQKDGHKHRQLTHKEIYAMLHAKSSNIVKWILIISLLEFAFWIVISIVLDASPLSERVNDLKIDQILLPLTIVSYVVLAYFFYQFYKNYKNISTTDTSKQLIENILKTRQTVKQYVVFNLAFLVLGTFIAATYGLKQSPIISNQLNAASLYGGTLQIYAGYIMATVITLAIVVGLLLLIYSLTYGLLLKRLNRNRIELDKMEI